MSRAGFETEIKLPVPNANAARGLLRAAGFRVVKGRLFEENTVFDTRESELRRSGRLLRLRESGGIVTFTYKGPPEISRHKTREELELTILKAQSLPAILERLGFLPVYRYEKYRTELQLPGRRGLATIDETPVGVYIELEGTPQWIDRSARRLGFTEKDYVTASYAQLYLDWCARHGTLPSNMVF